MLLEMKCSSARVQYFHQKHISKYYPMMVISKYPIKKCPIREQHYDISIFNNFYEAAHFFALNLCIFLFSTLAIVIQMQSDKELDIVTYTICTQPVHNHCTGLLVKSPFTGVHEPLAFFYSKLFYYLQFMFLSVSFVFYQSFY